MDGRRRRLVGIGRIEPTECVSAPETRANEIAIRNLATSLNFHDLVGIAGQIANAVLPRVPFSDNAGIVEAIGSEVSGFAIGDRVMAGFFPNWLSGPPDQKAMSVVLGDQIDGGLQTRLIVPAHAVVSIPANLSFQSAATLGCAGLTAWRALATGPKPLQAGQTVLLQGTGGVSLFALSLAKSMGAKVIHLSSSEPKLERLRSLGADVTINYRAHPNWSEQVRQATDAQGVDLVVEVAGGETLPQSIQACRFGGRIALIGVLTGFESANFPLAHVMIQNQTIDGITVGSIADLRAFSRAVEQNGIEPVIDSVFPLDDLEAAITHMESQKHFGKIVIDLA